MVKGYMILLFCSVSLPRSPTVGISVGTVGVKTLHSFSFKT